MDLELRKLAKFVDKTFIEGGKKAKEPVLLVSVAAVFKNPWHGKGFVEDLKPIILDLAPKLGDVLVPELIKEIGSPEKILAYGKAGTVGLNGEVEHASAFIHTLRFGNKFYKYKRTRWFKDFNSNDAQNRLWAKTFLFNT